MNILRLKHFIAVAENGSFSEAAERLYTTQSSVSKQVMALEKELGVRLFNRTSRKIELTPQGGIVLEHARKLAAGYDEMMARLSAYEQSCKGYLSIVSIPVMAQYGITSIVADFNRLFPHITLNIEEMETCDIPAALENGTYDLAFMRSEMVDASYETIAVCRDHLAAVLPFGHRLAAKEVISLKELKDDPFLLLNKGTLLYSTCLDACRKAGFTPKVAYTGTRMETIAELAAQNMGVSLMMAQAVSYLQNREIRIIPLSERIESCISLIRLKKRDMTPAAAAFWNYVKKRDF
ncbi:LysR family transcriptional regulator [Clostridium sp. MCC353]|uniref:LysR family transcriptional regulator n=1 Tax=Clostridium sp. MCC353 TaxID=2592646 RepID=UPI001C01631E|nr:LysR family transcriptional regulator [Clostridium sp. MCC353]MBT9777776.1 LysR family transcriptional regulator [Clostridium sp. MCC353]